MKKHFIKLFTAAALVASLASCSDDPKLPGEDLKQKSYTDEEVTVSLNGDNAGNQVVTFTPIAGEESKANITIASKPLNLSGMIGRADTQPVSGIPSAGIIPGSPEVTFPVELIGDAKNCTFSGTATSEYCTFSYSGTVTDSKLSLDLTDVKLKNTSLAGTYKMGDFDGQRYFDIVRIEWDAEKDFAGLQPKGLILMASMMELIHLDNKKVGMLNALNTVLKEVTFGEDGSITAKYLDTKKPGLPETTAPKGLAQYVVTSSGELRLILNINGIIAAAAATPSVQDEETPSLDITEIMSKIEVEKLLTMAIPMISNGIPMSYGKALIFDTDNGEPCENTDENFVSFYLDTKTLLPILKLFVPLLEDADFQKKIVEIVKNDPEMGGLAFFFAPILAAAPDVINTTSKIEIGINLHKQ